MIRWYESFLHLQQSKPKDNTMFMKKSYTKTDKKIFLVCFLVAALAPFFCRH